MQTPDDSDQEHSALRDRIIGLGERSFRKSYFPQLQTQLLRLERFRMLFDHTREGLYLIDGASGNILDANRVGAGFSPPVLVGTRVTSVSLTLAARVKSKSPSLSVDRR